MSLSVQDVVPWSIIYGELNRRHSVEIKDMVVEVLIDYYKDRICHGWGRGDKTISSSVKYCLNKGYITHESLKEASLRYKTMLKEVNAHLFGHIDYYTGLLESYLHP